MTVTAQDLEALMYDLPLRVAAFRRRRGLTMRAAGRTIGVSSSTIHRIERGIDCDVHTLILVLRWIDNG